MARIDGKEFRKLEKSERKNPKYLHITGKIADSYSEGGLVLALEIDLNEETEIRKFLGKDAAILWTDSIKNIESDNIIDGKEIVAYAGIDGRDFGARYLSIERPESGDFDYYKADNLGHHKADNLGHGYERLKDSLGCLGTVALGAALVFTLGYSLSYVAHKYEEPVKKKFTKTIDEVTRSIDKTLYEAACGETKDLISYVGNAISVRRVDLEKEYKNYLTAMQSFCSLGGSSECKVMSFEEFKKNEKKRQNRKNQRASKLDKYCERLKDRLEAR